MTGLSNIYDIIEIRLITGGFQHGQRLRAESLRVEFGCSASTIREILLKLSAQGLVTSHEQRGFRMPELSDKLLNDLARVRINLESEGVAASIKRGGVGWESRLTAAHHKLSHIESRVTGDPDPSLIELWNAAEQEFHETLIDACGNDVMRTLHRNIYKRFRQQIISTDRKFDYAPENIQQHKGIVEAAFERDEHLVKKRIYEHLSRNLTETP